eukprot:scaffold1813_cov129-Isochrysis_galbana.AAC.6
MSGLCSFFHWKIFAQKIYLPQYTFPPGSARRSQRRAAQRHLTPGQLALSPGNPPSDRSTRSRWHKSHLHLPHLRAWRTRVSTTGGTNPSRTSWSVEGWIHSKKRNRLGQKTVEQLVRSHTNQSAAGCWKRAQTTDYRLGGVGEDGTRRGGTYACSGTRAKCPSCSRCPCPGGAPGRARRGRSCCCRSIADVDHSQHEGHAAATASRRGSAPCGSPGSERGRPSLCTSVSVIGLSLAVPKERMEMKNRGCDKLAISDYRTPPRSYEL